MMAFPELATDRIRLRPISHADLTFVFEHFSDLDVGKYLLDDDPLTSLEQAQAIIDFYVSPDAQSYNRWIVERKADHRPIGTCGYHKWNRRDHKAEIGYDLSPFAWGQGYMSEAFERIIAFGFGDMDLNRIEAIVHPENAASLKLLERHGFVREGLLREALCRDGVYYDHWLLSLLRREWPARGPVGAAS
ncbi:MAG: GNAT family N-acetyltransferase [Anaerolineales bacterium]|nr:GNAT family N-acetyltransferase [Anaerolineales bacterium]